MPTTDPDQIVVPLDDAECRALLLGGRIGRLAFTRNALPAIQPVCYCLRDREGVIPALARRPSRPVPGGAVVVLEGDDHDEHMWIGGSGPVVGPCRTIARPA